MFNNLESFGMVFSRLDMLFILPLLLILFMYEVISLMKSKRMNK